MRHRYTPLGAVFLVASILAVQVTPAVFAAEGKFQPALAKQMTVFIQGSNNNFGSGVIIKHSGNRYTVLTAFHVVKPGDNYSVKTLEDFEYRVINVNRVASGIDMATFEFESNRDYPVATLGNSKQIQETAPLYIVGYPKETAAVALPNITITSGTLTSIITRGSQNGYQFAYDNNTRAGMSGGPVFNDAGDVIAIHGQKDAEVGGDYIAGGAWNNLGMPIHLYQDGGSSNTSIAINSDADRAKREKQERDRALQAERERQEQEAVLQAERERQERDKALQAEREKQEQHKALQAEQERQEQEAVLQAERERQERDKALQAGQEKQERDKALQAEREKQEREAVLQAEREKQAREGVLQAEREKQERDKALQAERKKQEREQALQAEREKQEQLSSQLLALNTLKPISIAPQPSKSQTKTIQECKEVRINTIVTKQCHSVEVNPLSESVSGLSNNSVNDGVNNIVRGNTFFDQGAYNQAIEQYTSAIALDSSHNNIAYYNRGLAYYRSGQEPQSLKDFLHARDLFQKSQDTSQLQQVIEIINRLQQKSG